MQFNFQGKTVLVSGASRGIGREVASMFADGGACVAVHYNSDQAAADETVAQLAGTEHITAQANLAEADAVEAMISQIVKAFGQLDIVINNAGIYDLHSIGEDSYAQWQAAWTHTIGVNLLGPANLTFCAVRQMMAQGGGRIVNVSSRGAFRGEPDAPAYAASKAGLNAMGQSLAQKLAPQNIFIHTVAPGFVETEMAAEILSGPQGDGIRNQSPLGRVAKPEEVARTVLFLASDGTEFLTGCVVDVNGASYLRT